MAAISPTLRSSRIRRLSAGIWAISFTWKTPFYMAYALICTFVDNIDFTYLAQLTFGLNEKAVPCANSILLPSRPRRLPVLTRYQRGMRNGSIACTTGLAKRVKDRLSCTA